MSDKQLSPQEAIEALKASTEVTVGPELIAAALKMSPGVLRQHVRNGDYKISQVDICGSRIRFARKDFLQKIGELPPDEEKPTVEELLAEILKGVKLICLYIDLKIKDEKKTASCGNS